MNSKILNIFKLSRHRWVRVFIHLSAILLFFLPELLTNIDDNRPIPYGVFIKTIIYITIFYVNYFTVDYFIDIKRGRWKFVGMNCVLLLFASFVIFFTSHAYTKNTFHPVERPPINKERSISLWETPPPVVQNGNTLPPPPRNDNTQPPPPRHNTMTHAMARLSRDLLIATLIIALAFAVRMSMRWGKEQNTRADILASQRETELNNLKSQINPHFLFNTLNSIYALISRNPIQAQKAVHELSGMMRYAIYDTSANVTLKQEFDFINNYISLMKMRMNPNRRIDISMNCNGHCDYPIAPLLFIPIIENAFKYGNTGDPTKEIKIELLVNDCQVKCYTFNHFDNEKRKSHKDSGIGLSNLQRRLNIIYGNDASLKTIEHNNTFQVELTINLNNYKS